MDILRYLTFILSSMPLAKPAVYFKMENVKVAYQ